MVTYKDLESRATRYSGFTSLPTSLNGGIDVCFSFSFNEGSPPMVTYKDGESSGKRYSGFVSIPPSFNDVCFSFSFNEGSPPMVTYKDGESSATRYLRFASTPASFNGVTDVCSLSVSMKAVLLCSRTRMENQVPPDIQGLPVYLHPSIMALTFVLFQCQ